jgi:hypothetical protein
MTNSAKQTATSRRFGLGAPTRHFIRHYVEMLIAMMLGMVVLGLPALAALAVFGVSSAELRADAPAALLLGMALTMTAPMIAWMRHRGHGWAASGEMAAAMFLPTFGVIALGWGGVVSDIGDQLMIEHVAMLPAMLVAMLLRRDEYSHGDHRMEAP